MLERGKIVMENKSKTSSGEMNFDDSAKKPYDPPKLVTYDKLEKITGWTGATGGEFVGGQSSGWDPWSNPQSS